MDDLNKALAEAKKPRPIRDVLKEKLAQLREQASGGGGGGGNGIRRGGNGGSGGPEDESFKESLDEIVQVILATVAFILVVTITAFFLCLFFLSEFNFCILSNFVLVAIITK